MKRLIVTLVAGALVVGFSLWFFSRPVVVLSENSPIWTTEDDASRQGTIFPGPAPQPKRTLMQGDRIRIVWIKYGKDYKAAFVVTPDLQSGWVLTTQDGISG
ncbi:MAG: hypothetical protein V4675_25130 [Verrucomicrobiota bacterium]